MTKNVGARMGIVVPVLAGALVAGIALGALSVTPVAVASPALQGDTTVAISPAQLNLVCGDSASVDIRINDVTDLFAVDVRVSYDPNVVEVVDANATAPGVQIQQGDLPDVGGGQGLIQINSVDTATGTINYAATRLNPAPAQSGSGVIASITFRGRAAGTSPINLVSVLLSNREARAIQADQVNGQATVTCTSPPPDRTGTPPYGPTPTRTYGPTPTRPYGVPTPIPGKECHHLVTSGETLYSIARRYGTTVAAFLAVNNLANPNYIYVGQKLVIPGCQPGNNHVATPDPYRPTPDPYKPPTGECYTYIVKPGDTLSRIAYASGDSAFEIARRNGVANPNLIYAGQRLTICPKGSGPYYPPVPPTGKCRYTHIVKLGDTVYRLALQYGSSVGAISAANGLANPNLIYAGQTLCIP